MRAPDLGNVDICLLGISREEREIHITAVLEGRAVISQWVMGMPVHTRDYGTVSNQTPFAVRYIVDMI